MSDAPICYSYDPAAGNVYVGSVAADPSPLEPGVWLYPAKTTLIPPPAAASGTAAVWESGAWSKAPDHRGEEWWKPDGEQVVIVAVGDPAAQGLLQTRPAPPAATQPAIPPVPETISEGQFMEQLALQSSITWDECNAYLATGTIPAIFLSAISKVPTDTDPNAQNKAKARFIGANSFDRHNPLTLTLAQLIGWNEAQLDDLWKAAAAIR